MNLIKTLSIFNLFLFNFFCFGMQRQMILSAETMPLVLIDIKKINPDASEQEYDKLYQKIREQGETLDCISKFRRAKRQLKLEALQHSELFSMSDSEWNERIEKPVQEIKKQLEKPELTRDNLILDNLPKNIAESIKKIYTQKNLHVPLTIIVNDKKDTSSSVNLNDTQDCYIFPIHSGYFNIWSDFTPLHEFTHVTEGDVIYGNVLSKVCIELYQKKKQSNQLEPEELRNYTLVAHSYARAREKVADQIPAVNCSIKENQLILVMLKIMQQIEKKGREDYKLKNNKECVESRPIHPSMDKRVRWSQKIYNLKKAEERLIIKNLRLLYNYKTNKNF